MSFGVFQHGDLPQPFERDMNLRGNPSASDRFE